MHSVGASVSCSFGKRKKLEVRRDMRRKEKQTCDIFELYLSLIELYAVDTEGGGGGYLSLILRTATAVCVCCFPLYYFIWIVIGRILGVQGEFAAAVSRLLRCLEDMSRLVQIPHHLLCHLLSFCVSSVWGQGAGSKSGRR